MKRTKIALLAAAFLMLSAGAHAATYNVDADHTSVSFKVRHLLSFTQGHFKQFTGSVDYEPGKPESWKAEGVIQVASIDTGVPQRDKHLLSKDFFEVEKFPTITFKTTKVLESTAESAKIEGLMSMHGVEKPIVLDVQLLGVAQDPWGNTRAAFSATTKINRTEFGLSYNQALEAGKVLIGEEVLISLEVEGILKA